MLNQKETKGFPASVLQGKHYDCILLPLIFPVIFFSAANVFTCRSAKNTDVK